MLSKGGRRVWWIAALVGVWVAAGAVWVVGTLTSSTEAVPSGEPSSETQIEESDDRFTGIDDACDTIDLSGLEDITGLTWEEHVTDHPPIHDTSAESVNCVNRNFDASLKSSLTVAVFPSAKAAAEEYSIQTRNDSDEAEASKTDIDSIWTQSLLTVGDGHQSRHDTSIAYELTTQSDNLLYMHLVVLASPEDPIETYLDSPISDEILAIATKVQALAEDD